MTIAIETWSSLPYAQVMAFFSSRPLLEQNLNSHPETQSSNDIKFISEYFIVMSRFRENHSLIDTHSPHHSHIVHHLVQQHMNSLLRNLHALQGLPPQLVIFDFDGTLFDTRASVIYCMQKTVNSLLLDEVPLSVGEKIEDLIKSVWILDPR